MNVISFTRIMNVLNNITFGVYIENTDCSLKCSIGASRAAS